MYLKKTCGLLYAGIDNGAMLKIPGMGGPVPRQFGGAGEPGDLLLQVEVEPSPIFQREGNDVSVSRSIDFTDAILGRDLRCSPSHFSSLRLELMTGRGELHTRLTEVRMA